MAYNQNRWTPEEDRILLRHRTGQAAFDEIGRTHSIRAVRQRQWHLRHPEDTKTPGPPGMRVWTNNELKILRDNYPVMGCSKEMMALLPRFSRAQVRNKASKLKIKRKFLSIATYRTDGHRELLDQIRIRAKEDGMTLGELDTMVGAGQYFRNHWKRCRVNITIAMRAIEFFGGTLVIDWRDR
jgi:hypothetical protein